MSILQLERLAAGSIGTGTNVIFDSTVVSAGSISYDSATGVITLQDAGRYEFDWWAATQNSLSATGAGFTLVSSQGDVIIGNSPLKTGEFPDAQLRGVQDAHNAAQQPGNDVGRADDPVSFDAGKIGHRGVSARTVQLDAERRISENQRHDDRDGDPKEHIDGD